MDVQNVGPRENDPFRFLFRRQHQTIPLNKLARFQHKNVTNYSFVSNYASCYFLFVFFLVRKKSFFSNRNQTRSDVAADILGEQPEKDHKIGDI
jgi:hypothetical protein